MRLVKLPVMPPQSINIDHVVRVESGFPCTSIHMVDGACVEVPKTYEETLKVLNQFTVPLSPLPHEHPIDDRGPDYDWSDPTPPPTPRPTYALDTKVVSVFVDGREITLPENSTVTFETVVALLHPKTFSQVRTYVRGDKHPGNSLYPGMQGVYVVPGLIITTA